MRNIVLIVLLCISVKLYPIDLVGRFYESNDPDMGDYKFDKTFLIHTTYESDGTSIAAKELKYNYRIVYKNKIPFLQIGDEYKKEYLALGNDELLFLYESDNTAPVFIGVVGNPMRLEALKIGPDWGNYKVSSFLVEKNKQYGASNLFNIALFNPWVEGVNGYGLGEKISIHNLSTVILISNGFVSYQKPYLYEKNSRLKKVKITDINTQAESYYEFNDSPELVRIHLTGIGIGREFEIEILEVYPGTDWQDTCINFIIGW